MPIAVLHDGHPLDIEVHGHGPAVLLPVNPTPIEGPGAEELRRWGADPALGRALIDGLSDAFTVVAFDYEGHVLAVPKPGSLTPANIAADLLAVADAAGVDRFAYYGYSWLAMAGLHLALRSDRVAALAMGGYPPLGGPQAEMLRVTTATHRMAVANTTAPPVAPPVAPPAAPAATTEDVDWATAELTLSEGQTGQFVTLYEALQGFDERAALPTLRCPRLAFSGSADEMDYEPRWGGVHVSMARPLVDGRADLEDLGWRVEVLEGLDHLGAMQSAVVLPILRPFLLFRMG